MLVDFLFFHRIDALDLYLEKGLTQEYLSLRRCSESLSSRENADPFVANYGEFLLNIVILEIASWEHACIVYSGMFRTSAAGCHKEISSTLADK
jgi:hypothetical protein